MHGGVRVGIPWSFAGRNSETLASHEIKRLAIHKCGQTGNTVLLCHALEGRRNAEALALEWARKAGVKQQDE